MRPFAGRVRNLTAYDSPQTRALSATFALRNWEFAMDRRVWSITGRDAPEETLDVLWRETSDEGGYLWVRGAQDGKSIGTDVRIFDLQSPVDRWASVVVSAGVAGLYVYHNRVRVGGRADLPWPAFKGGIDCNSTVGAFSSKPLSLLHAAVGEIM